MPEKPIFRSVKQITVYLLIFLWVYTAISKVTDFDRYAYVMQHQVFTKSFSIFLTWGLPVVELITAVFLLIPRLTYYGLLLSGMLMAVFTGYVGSILLHLFPKVPCACGGIISALGWHGHLVLNTTILLLTSVTIYIIHRERRYIGNS